ncbi:hypothetical protein CC86DRAFT_321842, partial [Ophiobolus disseminans]
MDDPNNHDFLLPRHDIPIRLIPHAILEDFSDDFYRICWKPAEEGIVPEQPQLIRKHKLAEDYPHVVAAWEAKQREEKEDMRRTEGEFVAFAGRFFDRSQDERLSAQVHRRVDCDQRLLPGMYQHWGEVRSCETHPPIRAKVRVCKGCRVSHYAQESREFDRQLIMARGARVPVCESCAAIAMEQHGMGYRGCVCDSRWTCFRCREAELAQLAKAREEHVEGRCGRCSKTGDLVQYVDFCLHCPEWRIYA